MINKTLSNILNSIKPGYNKSPEYVCHEILQAALRVRSDLASFESGSVYCFTGTHWENLDPHIISLLTKHSLINYTGNQVEGSKRKAVEEMVKQLPYTVMTMGVEQAKGKINFQNGTLNLKTNRLEPHRKEDFFRYVLPYQYEPQATCPMFRKYLAEVIPDEDTRKVLLEYVGWLFLDMKLEKVLFLYGSGCNGKSVFVDIVEALVGRDNVCHESLSDMFGANGENHRANIVGKLLNTCSDVSPNAFSGDLFKRVASGEPISAKILYRDVISTKNYAKMLFCLNELPHTKDHSNGYYRRMLIVPFTRQIPQSRIDPYLARRIIKDELPGVMNLALQGRERLVKQQDFTRSHIIQRALQNYQRGTSGIPTLIIPPGVKL